MALFDTLRLIFCFVITKPMLLNYSTVPSGTTREKVNSEWMNKLNKHCKNVRNEERKNVTREGLRNECSSLMTNRPADLLLIQTKLLEVNMLWCQLSAPICTLFTIVCLRSNRWENMPAQKKHVYKFYTKLFYIHSFFWIGYGELHRQKDSDR